MSTGLAISHLLSGAISSSTQRKAKKEVNERTQYENHEVSDVVDFSKPHVESSLSRDPPKDMTLSDIYVEVVVSLDQKQLREQMSGSKETQQAKIKRIEELAAKIATNLNEQLIEIQGLASDKDNAKYSLKVEVFGLSTGNRFSRFVGIGEGHVMLEVGYGLTGEGKIIKHGRVRYVDPLSKSSFSKRCGRDSGEAALLAIVPIIAAEVKWEMPGQNKPGVQID